MTGTKTDDLVAFMNARLDEEGAAIKAIEDGSAPWGGEWEADGDHALRTHNGWVLVSRPVTQPFAVGVLEHIARYDPARTFREVEAKRRLLRQFELRGNSVRATVKPPTGGVWDDLLRILALPYADHPDYRREWQP